MSDEGLAPSESFENTVSFATLEDRPEIPSFDTKQFDEKNDSGWSTDTLLRLEVVPLGKTDGKVVIFGPQKEDGSRPLAVYNTVTREREPNEHPGLGAFIQDIASSQNLSEENGVATGNTEIIHKGDFISVRQFNPEAFRIVGGNNYKIESIRSGKS